MACEIFSITGQHPDGDTRYTQLLRRGRYEVRQFLCGLVHATMLEPCPRGKVKKPKLRLRQVPLARALYDEVVPPMDSRPVVQSLVRQPA
jgi:hypothetical protein